MEAKEVLKYAITVTTVNQKTILKFKDNTELIGYFDNNAESHSNTWNFMPQQQDNNKMNKIIINGYDLKSIEIITIL